MTCREMLSVVDAYLDGELSTPEIVRVHEHLINCERCPTILESEAVLHSLLRSDARDDEPPADLRARVLDLIRTSSPPSPEHRPEGPEASTRFRVVSLVVVGLVAVLLASIAGIRFWRSEDVPPFALEIAAKHRLYTAAHGATLQVTTSDVIQLVDWLAGHVGFPVRAPMVTTPTQRLIGGRVSSVADAPAAYLLYEWHGRALSLFVTAPQPGSRRESSERIVGGVELYTAFLPGVILAWWDDSGRLYTAVSDGSSRDLEEFAVLCVRSGPQTQAPARMRALHHD